MSKHRYADADVDNQQPVEGCDAYIEWMREGNHFEKVMILNRDNRKELRKVYGEPNGIWVGEYRYDIWFRDYKGERFCIMSAGEKGTCYEMKGSFEHLQSVGGVVVHFMDYTYRQLKANMPAKVLKFIKESEKQR